VTATGNLLRFSFISLALGRTIFNKALSAIVGTEARRERYGSLKIERELKRIVCVKCEGDDKFIERNVCVKDSSCELIYPFPLFPNVKKFFLCLLHKCYAVLKETKLRQLVKILFKCGVTYCD
jgi:hypothetical protein